MNTLYWRNKVLNSMRSIAPGYFVGLSSTAPVDNGTGVTEPAGYGYTRIRVTSFSLPSNGVISNTENIEFPISTGPWFTSNAPAAYWVLFDGLDAYAHVLAGGSLATPVAILDNNVVTIPAGEIEITMRDADGTASVAETMAYIGIT